MKINMSEQSQEQIIKPMETQAVEITDPKRIEEYNKLDLYVPPHETSQTYDQNKLKNDQYNKSSQKIGQKNPIEIAVWETDPNKESKSSHFRVHMRILNGRHRYLQNKNWKRKYYDFKPVEEKGEDPFLTYVQMRQHFDLQKTQTPKEKLVLIEETAERILKTKRIDMHKVSGVLKKLFVPQGLMSESTFDNICPDKYKDPEMAGRKKGKTFEEKGRDTKKVQEAKKLVGDKVAKLEAEKNKLQTELTQKESEMIGMKKAIGERDKVVEELESKLRILRETESKITCKCGNQIPVKVDVTSHKIVTK